jgi:putative ABC transport system permease protein
MRTNRQRVLLAVLGVAIGVAAVVTLVALGKGLERQADDDFKAIGTQVINLSLQEPEWALMDAKPAARSASRQRLPARALEASLAAMPEVELVSPVASHSCAGESGVSRQVSAVKPAIEQILGLKLGRGRFIHALDEDAFWVVLGAQAAQALAAKHGALEPGASLTLCGRVMRLAGVLSGNKVAAEVAPISLDDGILISTRAGERLDPGANINQFVLRARPDVQPLAFASQLSASLTELTGQQVQAVAARQMLELRRTQAETTSRFLVALSSLSLLVGSLGIVNVMLMAVLERRGEIGLRMAIGADDVDIALQFLAESVLLGLAGGGAGIVLGLAAAWACAGLASLPFVVPASGLAMAIGISTLVGMAAGLFPAPPSPCSSHVTYFVDRLPCTRIDTGPLRFVAETVR